ncbi:MAG: sigma-70 family RNA polymerase sigma factor [Erysipelotrichaceae bacterium]
MTKNNLITTTQFSGPKNSILRAEAGCSLQRYDLVSFSNEDLVAMYQGGNQDALDVLIHNNEKFVIKMANNAHNSYQSNLEISDLCLEGFLGLETAANKFDANQGFKFLTYAGDWINQAIQRFIYNEGGTIRIPVHVHANLNRLKKVMNQLDIKIITDDNIELVAETLSLSIGAVMSLYWTLNTQVDVQSLDKELGDDDFTLMDIVSDDSVQSPESLLNTMLLKEQLDKALRLLSSNEAEIISLFFGLNNQVALSLAEIAIQMNLTSERVRQIKVRALNKLRDKSESLREFWEH